MGTTDAGAVAGVALAEVVGIFHPLAGLLAEVLPVEPAAAGDCDGWLAACGVFDCPLAGATGALAPAGACAGWVWFRVAPEKPPRPEPAKPLRDAPAKPPVVPPPKPPGAAAGVPEAGAGAPKAGAAAAGAANPDSLPASRRAASNSSLMRGEMAPVIAPNVVLMISAMAVSAFSPSAAA